jgi:hypothetical protein
MELEIRHRYGGITQPRQPMNDGEPRGDCFFIALQMIQDYSTEYDTITQRLEDNGVDPNTLNFSTLVLAHGVARMNSGKMANHAWIEVGDWVIDYSNGNTSVDPKVSYRIAKEIKEPKLFDRDTVLMILKSKPPSAYWGQYSRDDLDRIQRDTSASGTPWHRIDFVGAHKSNRNPFE